MKKIIERALALLKEAGGLTHTPEEQRGLDYWRERTLRFVLLIGTAAGLLVLIPTISMAVSRQKWWLIAIDTLFYGVALFLFFAHRKISYNVRAAASASLLYLIGMSVLIILGPASGGPAWLFAFTIIGGVFLGLPGAVITLSINIASLAVLGLLLHLGQFGHFSPKNLHAWTVAGLNFIFLNALAAITVALLLRGLINTLRSKNAIVQRLDLQQKRLSDAYDELEKLNRDRSRAEEARRRSDQRFRLSFERTASGMALISTDGIYIEVNSSLREISGYSQDELLGKSIFTIIAEDEADRVREAHRSMLQGQKESFKYEVRCRHKDGHFIWIMVNTSLFKGDSEQDTYFICQIQDITFAKQAEQALRSSEEKFSKAFMGSPVSVVIGSLDDDRFIDVNEAFLKTTGYSREELIGRTSEEVGMWADPLQRKQMLREVRQNGSIRNVEAKRISKSGKPKLFLYSGELITIDGEQCLVSVSVDITERKEAEDALRESEQRYEALFNGIKDMIYTHDLAGGIISINPAITDILGYDSADIADRKIWDSVPGDLREQFSNDYMSTLFEQGFAEGVMTFLDRHGNERYLEYKSTLVGRYGRGTHVSGVGRDITERVHAKKELAKLEEQLNQSQKMQAVGTLASGIAHDFNNILQAIRSHLDIVSLQPDALHRDGQSFERLDQMVQRAANLVKGLLTFSRKVEPELKLIDLNQEVVQTVELLRAAIPKMISLETDLDPELKMVRGDANQLEQVMMNLSANARDAMPLGGRIIFTTRNIDAEADGRDIAGDVESGEGVLLRVSDTGNGMSKEIREQIFNPFFTTKEPGRGTGLGLSSVFGIIKEHGGNIRCESAPGVGTSFEIVLPAAIGSGLGPEETQRPPQEVPTGRETVMVVDDEEAIREALRSVLQSQGYRVYTADSGEQALAIYQNNGRDIKLVVLDLGMPGMGGQACLRKLQELSPDIKVIVASGYSGGLQDDQTIETGDVRFMAKPYRLDGMLRTIREVLDS